MRVNSKVTPQNYTRFSTRRRNVGGGGGPANRGRGGKRGGGAGRGKRRKAPKDKMSVLDKYFV